jgi:hypothetical protein
MSESSPEPASSTGAQADERQFRLTDVRVLMLAAWDAGHSWEYPMSGDRENDVEWLLELQRG